MMLPSTLSEDHEALKPVAFLELSVLKTIVMKLLLLKIGEISVMVPHNLIITLLSESKTAKKEESAFTILFIRANRNFIHPKVQSFPNRLYLWESIVSPSM